MNCEAEKRRQRQQERERESGTGGIHSIPHMCMYLVLVGFDHIMLLMLLVLRRVLFVRARQCWLVTAVLGAFRWYQIQVLLQFVILPLRAFVLGLLDDGVAVCPPSGHRAGLTEVRATSLR